VDPLTREGIYFAMRSGELAAAALASSSPGARYAEALRDEIHPELARAAALKDGFFTSRFTDLLVEALRRSAGVRAVMSDLVAGEQSYATLKRRLLGTFEVGLAWRLLMLEVRGMVS
jgi:flavin-dependent dehydrogenase